jgi:hypothetical protein
MDPFERSPQQAGAAQEGCRVAVGVELAGPSSQQMYEPGCRAEWVSDHGAVQERERGTKLPVDLDD